MNLVKVCHFCGYDVVIIQIDIIFPITEAIHGGKKYIKRYRTEEHVLHKDRYPEIPHLNAIINHATESGIARDVIIRAHYWYDYAIPGTDAVAIVPFQLYQWRPSDGLDVSTVLMEIWPEVAFKCPDPNVKVCPEMRISVFCMCFLGGHKLYK